MVRGHIDGSCRAASTKARSIWERDLRKKNRQRPPQGTQRRAVRQLRKKSGLEKIFGEYDGINEPEDIMILPKKELIDFFKKQGRCNISTLGREMFAVYEK